MRERANRSVVRIASHIDNLAQQRVNIDVRDGSDPHVSFEIRPVSHEHSPHRLVSVVEAVIAFKDIRTGAENITFVGDGHDGTDAIVVLEVVLGRHVLFEVDL